MDLVPRNRNLSHLNKIISFSKCAFYIRLLDVPQQMQNCNLEDDGSVLSSAALLRKESAAPKLVMHLD